MEYAWQDLPKPKHLFTVRNAVLKNLDSGETIQYYSANTKIVVVQKCVTPTTTFYRTEPAAQNHLNYAFEASAFGLPNEIAPSAHYLHSLSFSRRKRTKQTSVQKDLADDGAERTERLLSRLANWRKKWQNR